MEVGGRLEGNGGLQFGSFLDFNEFLGKDGIRIDSGGLGVASVENGDYLVRLQLFVQTIVDTSLIRSGMAS